MLPVLLQHWLKRFWNAATHAAMPALSLLLQHPMPLLKMLLPLAITQLVPLLLKNLMEVRWKSG
jgi:hypothetical protein